MQLAISEKRLAAAEAWSSLPKNSQEFLPVAMDLRALSEPLFIDHQVCGRLDRAVPLGVADQPRVVVDDTQQPGHHPLAAGQHNLALTDVEVQVPQRVHVRGFVAADLPTLAAGSKGAICGGFLDPHGVARGWVRRGAAAGSRPTPGPRDPGDRRRVLPCHPEFLAPRRAGIPPSHRPRTAWTARAAEGMGGTGPGLMTVRVTDLHGQTVSDVLVPAGDALSAQVLRVARSLDAAQVYAGQPVRPLVLAFDRGGFAFDALNALAAEGYWYLAWVPAR